MNYNLEELGYTEEELFSKVDKSELESEKITAPRYSYWQSVFRVFFKKKENIVILVILGIIVLFSYVYPVLTSYDPFANVLNGDIKHLSPIEAMSKLGYNIHNLFGTGAAGQSTFDAVWYGSRISMSLAFTVGAINITVGVIVGAIWGFSKKVDIIMQEIYNIVANVPYLLVIAVMIMLFTPSFWTLVLALTVTGWLSVAYFIRTQVVIIRDREYNLASRCLGTSTFKIAMKNILPFMTSIIVTILAGEIPSYIAYEMFLAYIGMGISEMSLGKLMYSAEASMLAPGWQFEFWSPVAVASIIAMVLYIAGQNLGDASDPRTHM